MSYKWLGKIFHVLKHESGTFPISASPDALRPLVVNNVVNDPALLEYVSKVAFETLPILKEQTSGIRFVFVVD